MNNLPKRMCLHRAPANGAGQPGGAAPSQDGRNAGMMDSHAAHAPRGSPRWATRGALVIHKLLWNTDAEAPELYICSLDFLTKEC